MRKPIVNPSGIADGLGQSFRCPLSSVSRLTMDGSPCSGRRVRCRSDGGTSVRSPWDGGGEVDGLRERSGLGL